MLLQLFLAGREIRQGNREFTVVFHPFVDPSHADVSTPADDANVETVELDNDVIQSVMSEAGRAWMRAEDEDEKQETVDGG